MGPLFAWLSLCLHALPYVPAQPPPSPLAHLCSDVNLFLNEAYPYHPLKNCYYPILPFFFFFVNLLPPEILYLLTHIYLFTVSVISFFLLEYKLCDNGYFCLVPQCKGHRQYVVCYRLSVSICLNGSRF